jgi:DNA primase
LFVCDGNTPGRVLVTCYANCDRLDIIEELKRQTLWPTAEKPKTAAPQVTVAPQATISDFKTTLALKTWRYARPADGTLVETYLRARAITLSPLPLTLRCFMGLRHAPSNGRWPAMVALVMAHDQERLGIHRTYLAWDGSGKALSRKHPRH